MSIHRKRLEYELEDAKKVFAKDLGSRIREVRLLKNMAKAGFAMALMVSMKTLSEIENGERQPDGRLLFVLEECFGVNGAWLMTGEGQMLRGNRANRKTEAAMRLLGMFGRLTENDRDKVVNIIKILLHKGHHSQKRINEGADNHSEGR